MDTGNSKQFFFETDIPKILEVGLYLIQADIDKVKNMGLVNSEALQGVLGYLFPCSPEKHYFHFLHNYSAW